MGSFKRRRAINIDRGYIELMKKAAKKLGANSGTAVASMIFVGAADTLPKLQAVSKPRGVSMTEAMWISIKNRGTQVSKGPSATAQDMLTGDEKPLTPKEISVGEARARERELAREAGEPEEDAPPKREPRTLTHSQVAEFHEEYEASVGDIEPQSEPQPEPTPEPTPPPPEPEPEPIPAIQRFQRDWKNIEPEPENTPVPKREIESEQSNIENAIRPDDAEDSEKYKMTLSKGQPASFENAEDRSVRKIKPGQKFYGGVFSF